MRLALVLLLLVACDPSRPIRNLVEGPCAPLSPLSVDTTCAATPCRVAIDQQGCTASLTFSAFDGATACPGPIVVELDANGRILGSVDPGSCLDVEPVFGAEASVECTDAFGSCRLDLLAKADPAFETTTIRVIERDLYLPESERCEGDPACLVEPLDYYSPFGGDLTAIAFPEGMTWVARRASPSGFSCADQVPSVLHFYDRASLLEIRTSTAPPCLAQLEVDPENPSEVIGLTGRARANTVGAFRLDRDGRVLANRAIDLPLMAFDRWLIAKPFQPIALWIRGEWIYGVWAGGEPNNPAIMVRLDRRTLDVDRVVPFDGERYRGVILGETVCWLIDRGGTSGKVLPIDLDSLTARSPISLDATRAGSDDGAQGLLLNGDQDLIISTTGSGGGIYFQTGDVRTLSFPFEADAVPFAVSRVPGEGTLVVGLTERNALRAASVALYTPPGSRFVPGQTPIGNGSVLAIEPDPEGRLWALLPWSGHVVVLEPK